MSIPSRSALPSEPGRERQPVQQLQPIRRRPGSPVKNALVTAAKFAVVIAALGYLMLSDRLNWSDFSFPADRLPILAAAVALVLATLGAGFIRHWLLLRAAGVPIGLADMLRVGSIGVFFNSLLFGGVGGDAVKLAYLIRLSGRRSLVVASVLVDRILGLLGLLAVAALSVIFCQPAAASDPTLARVSAAVFALSAGMTVVILVSLVALLGGRMWAAAAWGLAAAGLLLLGSVDRFGASTGALLFSVMVLPLLVVLPSCLPGGRLRSFGERLGPLGGMLVNGVDAVLSYRCRLRSLALCFGLSVVIQAVGIGNIYLIALALPHQQRVGLDDVCRAAPPALVSNMLPVPGGGLGVGEATFDQLLRLDTTAGGAENGAAIFLTLRLLTVVVGLLGLPIYLFWKLDKPDQPGTRSHSEPPEPLRRAA